MLVPEQTVSITTAGQGRENAQVCHVDVTTSHSFGLYETFAEKQNHGNFPELISYMNALNWHTTTIYNDAVIVMYMCMLYSM